jgi:hypothetical protein
VRRADPFKDAVPEVVVTSLLLGLQLPHSPATEEDAIELAQHVALGVDSEVEERLFVQVILRGVAL